MSDLKIVLSLITHDNDYQLEQARVAKAVAQQQDFDLEILYADSNSLTQSAQLLDVIHKYKSTLSAILVEPAGGTEFPQVAGAAVNMGIAWVLLNRDAGSSVALRRNQRAIVFAVSADHEQVGQIQAQQLAALLPQEANVLCIQGPASSLAAQRRLAGLESAKPSRLTLKMLRSPTWIEEGGYHAISSWLRLSTSQKQPISAVAAQNDSIAMGARKAFEDAKLLGPGSAWSRVLFLGVDGLPRTGQSFVKGGLLTATVVVPIVTGRALQAVVNAITTKVAPPEMQLIPGSSYPTIESLHGIAAAAEKLPSTPS